MIFPTNREKPGAFAKGDETRSGGAAVKNHTNPCDPVVKREGVPRIQKEPPFLRQQGKRQMDGKVWTSYTALSLTKTEDFCNEYLSFPMSGPRGRALPCGRCGLLAQRFDVRGCSSMRKPVYRPNLTLNDYLLVWNYGRCSSTVYRFMRDLMKRIGMTGTPEQEDDTAFFLMAVYGVGRIQGIREERWSRRLKKHPGGVGQTGPTPQNAPLEVLE